jgi:hypothetical protein
MALSDPQSVTIGGTATSLPNVERNGGSAVYQKDDGTVVLKVQHQGEDSDAPFGASGSHQGGCGSLCKRYLSACVDVGVC